MATNKSTPKQTLKSKMVEEFHNLADAEITVKYAVFVGSMVCMVGVIGLTAIALNNSSVHISVNPGRKKGGSGWA